MENRKKVVVALGGNALGNTPKEQLELIKKVSSIIVDLVQENVDVIVSHGNGPQVGMIQNAFDESSKQNEKIPSMPLPEAGAMSQGYIGYQLAQGITNVFKQRKLDGAGATILTQTLVDKNDEAFKNPTKPVGSFMTEEEAKAKAKADSITVTEDAGRGWRQVVASPQPKAIVEIDAIKNLVNNGYTVIAGGGGGVPVIEENDQYVGVPAVIDKDRSSAKIAAEFEADTFIILTAVEKVFINYNKENEQALNDITIQDCHKYIEEGQFAAGSMLPKVEACIEYLNQVPEGRAIITSLEKAKEGLTGQTGTTIRKS
ncbi:carbamate kinase [Lactobacillus sp. YT155]|uniref:carbamate kinase n=1 Tax=Lactobacillus sp. YT155 TaxID=3060955 RepID=UPI0026603318|nr:carbamate kinase [Lactobacillus sp. YT155]MDO1604705.1 carbamate kinase [Lactobacillus sp. YT155]